MVDLDPNVSVTALAIALILVELTEEWLSLQFHKAGRILLPSCKFQFYFDEESQTYIYITQDANNERALLGILKENHPKNLEELEKQIEELKNCKTEPVFWDV